MVGVVMVSHSPQGGVRSSSAADAYYVSITVLADELLATEDDMKAVVVMVQQRS